MKKAGDWHRQFNGSKDYEGKSTHKLTPTDYAIISSLEGQMSMRQASVWWHENHPDRPPVAASTVHRIWHKTLGTPRICSVCGGFEAWGYSFRSGKQKNTNNLVCTECEKLLQKTKENKARRLMEEEKASKQVAHILDEDEGIVLEDLPPQVRLQVFRGANLQGYSFTDLFPTAWGSKKLDIEMDITEGEDVFGAIYGIILPGSDKVYVGQTTKGVMTRFRGHLGKGTRSNCGTQDYRELIEEIKNDKDKMKETRVYLLDMIREDAAVRDLTEEQRRKLLYDTENAWMYKLLINGYELYNTKLRINPEYYSDLTEYVRVRGGDPLPIDKLCIGTYIHDSNESTSDVSWVFKPQQSQPTTLNSKAQQNKDEGLIDQANSKTVL